MTTDGRVQIQQAIYAALTGDATLMGKITGVFDFVPDNQNYPFIQIGEIDFKDWDSHTFVGFEGEITINLWHRPQSRGRAPLYDIMADINNILDRNYFTIPGFSVIVMKYEFSNIIVDPDMVTYHGITRYKIIMGEN